MKTPVQLLTVLFAVFALGVTVWLGRYGGAVSVAPPTPPQKLSDPNELPIPEDGPTGTAIFSKTTHDFGAVVLGSKGQHTFVITNKGEGPLHVKTGKTSCSQCTVAKTVDEEVPPGGSVNIEINWEIKSPNEKFRQWAEVFTTDPKQKRVELVIEGMVDQTLRLVPEAVWSVGDLSATEPKSVKGLLYSRLIDEFSIEKFECSNPIVAVTWEKAPVDSNDMKERSAKSAMSITVTVAAGASLGPFRETVKLFTTVKDHAPIEFHLTGQRLGPIEFRGSGWNAENNAVVLGEFPASEGSKAKLNLYVRNLEGELEIQGIEQRSNSVKLRVSPMGRVLGKSKMYEVEIEVPPGPSVMRRGPEAERVRLKLNHPDAQEFIFYVSYHSL